MVKKLNKYEDTKSQPNLKIVNINTDSDSSDVLKESK